MRGPSSQTECRVRWGSRVPAAAGYAFGPNLETKGGVWAGRHIQGRSTVKCVSFGTGWTGVQLLTLSFTTGMGLNPSRTPFVHL